jgi:hypothetical protein
MFEIPTKEEIKDYVERNKTHLAYLGGYALGTAVSTTLAAFAIHQNRKDYYSIPRSNWNVETPRVIGNAAAKNEFNKHGFVKLNYIDTPSNTAYLVDGSKINITFDKK